MLFRKFLFLSVLFFFLPLCSNAGDFIADNDSSSAITKAEAIGKQIRSRWQKEVPLDETSLSQNGIRKIQEKQITLYTDLPNRKDVDELLEVFAQFVPQCCRFFGLDEKNYTDFHIECFLIGDFDKFKSSGAVAQVPKLKNGYALRSRIWLRSQANPYYQRHLFLHECVHALMGYAFGHWGPPWYREGTAELLSTHRWENGKLTLGVVPKTPADFPRWGRIEYVRQDIGMQSIRKETQQKEPLFMPLEDMFNLTAEDYNENESYAWSWAFAAFCTNHTSYREAFRQTSYYLSENFIQTNQRFFELVRKHNSEHAAEINLANDWLDFQRNICYGYDFGRTKIDYPQNELPLRSKSKVITVKTNCGWQSSGLILKKGRTYSISATGRFQLGNEPKPWLSEPNGITVKYYNGEPLGRLLAAVVPNIELQDEEQTGIGFHCPLSVGLNTEWEAPETGVLFFRINDVPSELGDNTGTVSVSVSEK
ncbi:MAG: hypothetical protein FWE67_06190 [Planctomycetaceae bacterium]|nr:hypothetical protein [Planctomycetaceae bacterium]